MGRSQVVLDRNMLNFTTADWHIPQAIRVKAVDDNELENGEQKIALTITPSGADENYNALQIEPVIVSVLDNECGAWRYAISDLNRDCVIDINDLRQFAEDWLSCSHPEQSGCSDYRGIVLF